MAFPAAGYSDLAAAEADGLQHYWPFDEGSTYAVTDLIGGFNGVFNGWLMSTASVVSGLYGNARRTYGFASPDTINRLGEVNLAALGSPVTHNDWTLVFRVKPYTVTGTNTFRQIIGLNELAGLDEGYCMLYSGGNAGGNHSLWSLDILYETGDIWHWVDVTAPSADTWHTVVIVNNSVADTCAIYIDNVLAGTIPKAAPLKFGGYSEFANSSWSAKHYRGELDDMGLWNRVLTVSEIADVSASVIVAYQGDPAVPYPVEWQYVSQYSALNYVTRGIAYDGVGRWIACGYDNGGGGLKVFVSDNDGATWTQKVVVANTFRAINQLVYAEDIWVGVGSSGILYYSLDEGETWTERTNGVTGWGSTTEIDCIAYGNGVWVMTGFGGRVAWSTDPVAGTFTLLAQAQFGVTSEIPSVVYQDGVWLVAGQANDLYKSTDDSQTYTNISGTITADNPLHNALAVTGGAFLSAGRTFLGSGTPRVFRSADSVAWVVETPPSPSSAVIFNKAAGGLAQWVVSGSGYHFYGFNGDWTRLDDFNVGLAMSAIAYGNVRFLAVGQTRFVFSGTIEAIEVTQDAAIDVEVGIDKPVMVAATAVYATIAPEVDVIVGTVKTTEIAAEVGVISRSYTRTGFMDLLDQLVGYYPLDALNIANPNAFAEKDIRPSKWTDEHRGPTFGLVFQGVQGNILVDGEGEYIIQPDEQWLLTHYNGAARFSTVYEWENEPSENFDDLMYLSYENVTEGPALLATDFTTVFWVRLEKKPFDYEPTPFDGLWMSCTDTSSITENVLQLECRWLLENGDTLYEDRVPRLYLQFARNGGDYSEFWPPYTPPDTWYTLISDGSAGPVFEMPYDEWAMVAITRGGDRLRVRANLQTVFDIDLPAGMAISENRPQLYGTYYHSTLGLDWHMWGFMDEIGYWGRELQPDELGVLYNAQLGLTYPFQMTALGIVHVGVGPAVRSLVRYDAFAKEDAYWRFSGVVTGAADSLPDIEVPISSWQATRQVEENSGYLNLTIPATAETADAIAARPNGRIIVRARYTGRGTTWEEDFISSSVNNIQLQQTARKTTIQLAGNEAVPQGIPVVHRPAEGIAFSVQGGRRRLRVPLDLWIKPGDTVEFGAEVFEVGWVNMYASRSGAFMDIGEVDG